MIGCQRVCLLLWVCLCVMSGLKPVMAQEANYDEAKVPAYTLPDLLTDLSGAPVTTPQQWQQRRRAEVLSLFEQHVFGRLPNFQVQLRTKLRSEVPDAVGGLAHRRELTVYFTAEDAGPQMDLLIYTPAAATGPVPAFLGLNFNGNQAIESDPRLHLRNRGCGTIVSWGLRTIGPLRRLGAANPVVGLWSVLCGPVMDL